MIKLESLWIVAGEDGYFNYPSGICCERQQGMLYITDMHNNKVCWLDMVTKDKGELEGDIIDADKCIKLIKPLGITLYTNKELLITDAGYNNIFRRKIGTNSWIPVVDSRSIVYDVNCIDSGFPLNLPSGVTCDEDMNIYTNDFMNNRILKIDASGKIVTLVGGHNYGYLDGSFKRTLINKPYGLYYRDKKLYFVDTGNNLVRYIDLVLEEVFTIKLDKADALINPIALTLDPNGNIYVCEHRRMHFINGNTFEISTIIDRNIWEDIKERFSIKEKLSYVGAITVPQKGEIYWIDTIKGLIYGMIIGLKE